jgi:CelD/BcsL family acetyltransferase involved in cellulose biosynthesis
MDVSCLDSLSDTLFLDPSDERWVAYITSKPESSIFHHPAWLHVLAECYGYRPFVVAVCDETGQIKAGLPLMEVRSLVTGRRWVSLPFTDYCAPLHDDEESLHQLTRDLVTLYQAGSVPKIEIRWELPALSAIQLHPAYYLHTVKLDSDPQVVMKGFKRTNRQNIGTAEKRGVHIERGTEPEHLRRYYGMQRETRRRKGLPVQPWKFFELLGENVLAQGLGFVLLAYKDAQCLAGGLFLHWQQTLTYKYAASSGEGQQYRPNNLLSWTAMRWGCENGFTVFDLGRTDLENAGLRRFKKGWGAQESPLTYSMLSAAPRGISNGKLMSWMETVIQKAPPWVCRAAGELLYRYFG